MNLVKSICKFHYDQNPYHLNNRVHENDHINGQSPHWYSIPKKSINICTVVLTTLGYLMVEE